MKMLELFQSARNVSVPLVVIRTVDQMATAEAIRAALAEFVVVTWDAARGMMPAMDVVGRPSGVAVAALGKAGIKADETVNFADAMVAAAKLPRGAVLIAYNAHRQLTAAEPLAVATNVQSVSNLRDVLKRDFRMLVLLGPTVTLPGELEQDVVVIDHELPGIEELATVTKDLYASAKLPAPSDEVVHRATDATSGLSLFAAEQVVAMSLTPQGLNLDALWERKRVTIEQTPGLTVWRGRETFTDLVGLAALKAHLRRRMQSKRRIGVVVWIDEIDKALANVEQDTSGVRMYQLLKLLTEMENNEWTGFVGVGVAGGGKSLIAKAFGNEAGVPTIALDLGATESKYVGDSEANLLHIMQVIKAVGHGNAYFIATSNAATVMRPELQRRFSDGMWFFDLMTMEEREAAWQFYTQRYELQAQTRPADEGWTGAEIRNACRYAWETDCALVEAAQMVVPMAQSRADDLEQLRRYAHGRFLNVGAPGWYEYTPQPMQRMVRAIALPGPLVDEIQRMPES